MTSQLELRTLTENETGCSVAQHPHDSRKFYNGKMEDQKAIKRNSSVLSQCGTHVPLHLDMRDKTRSMMKHRARKKARRSGPRLLEGALLVIVIAYRDHRVSRAVD